MNQPVLVIDAIGQRCPLPVIELARRIADVPVGSVVEVLADDPAAAPDIAAWCRMRTHDYLGAEQRMGATAYQVQRTH
jgi:tRNA 2-thiouridine synthesizing protein A